MKTRILFVHNGEAEEADDLERRVSCHIDVG